MTMKHHKWPHLLGACCILLIVGLITACRSERRTDTYYGCQMGITLDSALRSLDKEGIRYHDMVQDSSVCIFLDNINDHHGVHFDVVQMYFDGRRGKRLGMVGYSSLRSIDSEIDFQTLRTALLEEYRDNTVTDSDGLLECKRGSLRIRLERINPRVYPGVYLTYTDTLYTEE